MWKSIESVFSQLLSGRRPGAPTQVFADDVESGPQPELVQALLRKQARQDKRRERLRAEKATVNQKLAEAYMSVPRSSVITLRQSPDPFGVHRDLHGANVFLEVPSEAASPYFTSGGLALAAAAAGSDWLSYRDRRPGKDTTRASVTAHPGIARGLRRKEKVHGTS